MTELAGVSGAFGYGGSILAGERVRLRGVRDDDLPALAKRDMDPGRLATLSRWVAPRSEAAAQERIARWSANDNGDPGLAVETLQDPPVLAGHIGLRGASAKDRRATLGIALGREHTGRGYGPDAMRVIVGYAFRELGRHRRQPGAAPFNPAGIRAGQKAGFIQQGRHRESVLPDGHWYDQVLMPILGHERAARRSSARRASRHGERYATGQARTHAPNQKHRLLVDLIPGFQERPRSGMCERSWYSASCIDMRTTRALPAVDTDDGGSADA